MNKCPLSETVSIMTFLQIKFIDFHTCTGQREMYKHVHCSIVLTGKSGENKNVPQ